MFHQPAGPASAVTSHCSSSRAPLDDSGKSPLTHDEPSFFNGDRSECVYVSAFVYAFVFVCMWRSGWGLRLMCSAGVLRRRRGFIGGGRWLDGGVGGGGGQ